MTLHRKLLVTLLVCLAIILATTYALHVGQRHETAALSATFAHERQEQLDDAVAEESESLGLFAQDYSNWDEMVAFVSTLDPEWAQLNIAAVFERFRLSSVWLVAPDGKVIFSYHAPGKPPLSPPSALPEIARGANWQSETGGFYREADRIVDLRARPVQPTADTGRTTEPVAWLVAARVLDDDMMARLSRRLQARVALTATGGLPDDQPKGWIEVRHPLPGLLGAADPGEVHAQFRIAALELGEHYNRREMLVWVLAVILLVAVAAWTMNRHVLRPLACIGQSLESDSLAPLARIRPGQPEFARIAGLVREAFNQREALRREIDERVRLGRDLHDGVIQNLYATGMGIAHGVRLMSADPVKAAARLEDTLRSLNDTMATLRGYIARAEPEAAPVVDFADACVTLFQTLRVERECELDLDVEPAADAEISSGHKATLLFIVREAVSNALRHGRARHIAVALRRVEGRWRLRVANDGAPHDFARGGSGPGRGLENIRARARELGGTPSFACPPAGGVEVTVEWPAA